MDHLRIGRSLRALRQRRGLTQAQLAEAAGVSQSLVSLIERGHLETVALRTIQRVPSSRRVSTCRSAGEAAGSTASSTRRISRS